MSVLIALYLLPKVLPAPIPSIENRPPSYTNPGDSRDVWSIFWSCIATVFACTWVSIHPNIPSPHLKMHWYSGSLRRARMMFYALIGPEFIILWAWHQRSIANEESSMRGWTRVHGFFAVMGGFVSPDGMKRYSREELERLFTCECPPATEDEIKDKSTADAVTKFLALLQTAWFMLQCAVRLSQHLAFTELELATAAFALLNMAIYVLWWDKPMDAQCPITMRNRCAHCQQDSQSMTRAAGQTGSREVDEQIEAHPGDDEQLHSPDRRRSPSTTVEQAPPTGSISASHHIVVSGRVRDWWNSIRRWSWSNVWKKPLTIFAMVLEPFNSMMGHGNGDLFFIVGWRGNDKHEMTRYFGSLLIATVFGGIHCLAWSFHFPSHTEKLLWRICSIATTSIPIVGTCSALVLGFMLLICNDNVKEAGNLFIVFPLVLYIFARIMLLILCLAALRSPPPSSLQAVQWLNLVPHV